MLYVLELEVQHNNTVNVVYENATTGSVHYINASKQTRIVEAADATEAQQKVQTYYKNKNTEFDTYTVTVLSISDTII